MEKLRAIIVTILILASGTGISVLLWFDITRHEQFDFVDLLALFFCGTVFVYACTYLFSVSPIPSAKEILTLLGSSILDIIMGKKKPQ